MLFTRSWGKEECLTGGLTCAGGSGGTAACQALTHMVSRRNGISNSALQHLGK